MFTSESRGTPQHALELEGKGIKLTRPYRKDPAMNNMGTAAMVDPWGVSIELTEGLRDLP